MRSLNTLRATTALAVTAVLVASCGVSDEAPSWPVVVTTPILGDLVTSIVGPGDDVRVLMPSGADPHNWSPGPQDVDALLAADLVVANGLGLEHSLEDLLGQVSSELFEVAPAVDPIPLDDGLDPHVWLDPVRMASVLDALAQRLAIALDRPSLVDAAEAVQLELLALDAEVRSLLARIPAGRRLLVTGHDALGYFAARYDLEVVGVVVPGGSTDAQADARHLAELAQTLKDRDVRVLFVDAFQSSRVAQALAGEVPGLLVVPVNTDTLGTDGTEPANYHGLLRSLATTIADALAPAGS